MKRFRPLVVVEGPELSLFPFSTFFLVFVFHLSHSVLFKATWR